MNFDARITPISLWVLPLALATPVAAQTTPPAPDTAAAASAPIAAEQAAPFVPPPAHETPAKPACRLGAQSGTAKEDAATLASLVCRELAGKSAAQGHHYRVDVDTLGSHVYLTLSDEDQPEKVGSRRMRLGALEEGFEAAPRVASALLSGKALSETERVGNLTEAESRAPLRKVGRTQFGVGVLGVYAPSVSTLAPGFELSLRYDTPSWVAHTSLRYAAHVETNSMQRDDGLRLFDWGVGARYMLSQQDLAPFVGAGLAYMAVQRDEHREDGLGAFGEIGLEMLRLHRNHVGAALRADAPLFAVSKRYVMPLSLTVSLTF